MFYAFAVKFAQVFEGRLAGLPRCSAILTVLIAVVLLVAALPSATDFVAETDSVGEESMLTDLPRIEIVEGSFKRNTTLVATLVDLDIPAELAESVARLIQPVFDVRDFRFGKPFKI